MRPPIRSANLVVVAALAATLSAIWPSQPQADLIVRAGETIDGITLETVGNPAINNAGEVIFVGQTRRSEN